MSTTDTDEYGDQYEVETFLRRVTSVTDPGQQLRQVRRHFTTVDPDTVSAHMQEVFSLNARGSARALQLLIAASQFVGEATDHDLLAIENVNLAARRRGDGAVSWFLLDPPPLQSVDQLRVTRSRSRAMTLGERRQVASGWDPTKLERLLNDTNPMVIERLCRNPRINESHILTIVTRRPTLPEILETVARSPRWFRNQQVRYAIAHNPYGPVGLSLRIIPLLPVNLIHRIRFSQELHPALGHACAYMVGLRDGDAGGPMPEVLDRLNS